MAKRKRLSPAQTDYLAPRPEEGRGLKPMGSMSGPPIAQVAGDAAALSALREVSETLTEAREEGRLVQKLPLDAIEAEYLTRDRLALDAEEMQALTASIRARGQQTPIEVVDRGQGRYGLISGWRRLSALRRIAEAAPETTVLAIVRQPETASDAYVAMVEENEIRVGLSYFERARIVVKTVEAGVYPDDLAALRGLFGTASKARRSKIGSFMTIVREIGDLLQFPEALPEGLGLRIVKFLRLEDGPETLRAALASPADTAESERGTLTRAMAGKARSPGAPEEIVEGLLLTAKGQGVTLAGPRVTPELTDRLRAWLKAELG